MSAVLVVSTPRGEWQCRDDRVGFISRLQEGAGDGGDEAYLQPFAQRPQPECGPLMTLLQPQRRSAAAPPPLITAVGDQRACPRRPATVSLMPSPPLPRPAHQSIDCQCGRQSQQ